MESKDITKSYKAPQVKVIEIKSQGVLCGSDPSLTGWGNGSNSDDVDMEEGE